MAIMASVTDVQVHHSDSKDYYKFVAWDNPDNVITFETYATMDNIFLCYLNPLIFIIGVPANVLSCVVFFRQGSGLFLRLHHRHHFCLLSCSFSSIFSVLGVTIEGVQGAHC